MQQRETNRRQQTWPQQDHFREAAASELQIGALLDGKRARTELSPDVVLHRSVLNDLPLFFAFCMASAAAARSTFVMHDKLYSISGYNPFLALALIVAAAFGLICATSVFRRYNARYLIASDGIKSLRGFLSIHQVDAKLEYYQIRGTEIHRSLFARLFNTGDLVVLGSSGVDTEVAFKGIRNPYSFQRVIQARHRREVQGSKSAWINERGSPPRAAWPPSDDN